MRPPLKVPLLAVSLALLMLAGLASTRAKAQQQGAEPLGIVSVRVTFQPNDAGTPWNRRTEQSLRGSALVVGTGLLLTTADLVKDATLIEVRKLGRYPDFTAKLVLVDYELDLALLSVEDADFWAGLSPLPFSADPPNFARFVISRWRSNGRFEQGTGEVVDLRAASSRFGSMELPIMRGTTNMAGLGWAEVMTLGGEVVGLISSHNNNEIQAIMPQVLSLFVSAASRQASGGFAHRGFSWQRLNHPALRKYHGLSDKTPGVLIQTLLAGGTGSGQLKDGDILMQLGPYEIDPEGMIVHPLYGSILFPVALNDTLEAQIPAKVLRGKQELTMSLTRERLQSDDYRIPTYTYGTPVDYEVFGGLVFQELTLGYLQAWGDAWQDRAPKRLVTEFSMRGVREADTKPERVLIISRVLPDVVNLGYQDLGSTIVKKVDSRAVTSLADFREAIRHAERGFHVIELLPGGGRVKLVFSEAELPAANRRIGERYDVPAPNLQKTAAR
jgi:hypothetical protein